MTNLTVNILHLHEYDVWDIKESEHDLHFQVEAKSPIACEECGVEGEFVRFVRFGKRDVAYRDMPIHGKRVTLWVVRRRYACRACGKIFRPELPEMVDNHRMTLRHTVTLKRRLSTTPTPMWLIPQASREDRP